MIRRTSEKRMAAEVRTAFAQEREASGRLDERRRARDVERDSEGACRAALGGRPRSPGGSHRPPYAICSNAAVTRFKSPRPWSAGALSKMWNAQLENRQPRATFCARKHQSLFPRPLSAWRRSRVKRPFVPSEETGTGAHGGVARATLSTQTDRPTLSPHAFRLPVRVARPSLRSRTVPPSESDSS